MGHPATLPAAADEVDYSALALDRRLAALVDAVPGRRVLTTSFGIEDQLLTHWIATLGLTVELATIDTGRLFPETYELWERTEARYGLRIRPFAPAADAISALHGEIGANGFRYSVEARHHCCAVRKVEPLGRILAGADLWLTGLRGDQSAARSGIDVLGWDEQRNLFKAAPLFDHDREQIRRACVELNVPVSTLHDRGFLSIGCQPCTRAVTPGEDERAGRWWWEAQGSARECGLHVAEAAA